MVQTDDGSGQRISDVIMTEKVGWRLSRTRNSTNGVSTVGRWTGERERPKRYTDYCWSSHRPNSICYNFVFSGLFYQEDTEDSGNEIQLFRWSRVSSSSVGVHCGQLYLISGDSFLDSYLCIYPVCTLICSCDGGLDSNTYIVFVTSKDDVSDSDPFTRGTNTNHCLPRTVLLKSTTVQLLHRVPETLFLVTSIWTKFSVSLWGPSSPSKIFLGDDVLVLKILLLIRFVLVNKSVRDKKFRMTRSKTRSTTPLFLLLQSRIRGFPPFSV